MNFYQHIEYNPGKQIWRILITDDDRVIFEKIDTEDKQIYFDCIDLETKENVFTDLQLDEKFWIGIEKIYKGIIIFHKFAKPDMPGHKEIIAFDIEKNEVSWRNEEYSFLFLYEDKVYAFKELFEGRKFVTLDLKTGKLIEELGDDADKINLLYDKARMQEDYSKYTFPKTTPHKYEKINSKLDEMKSELAIVGDVEYNVHYGAFLASYHIKESDNGMINKFSAFDVVTGEELFNEILASNIDSFMMDSFFVYKNYLFLLKDKKEVVIRKIERENYGTDY